MKTFCTIMACLVVGSAHSYADSVAFSSFGENDLHSGSGLAVGEACSGSKNYNLAFQFTSSLDGQFKSLDAAFSTNDSINTDRLEFSIWTDNGSEVGQLLWTGFTGLDNTPSGGEIITVASESDGPFIQAGSTYWLSARAEAGINSYGWLFTIPNASAPAAFDPLGGTDWNYVVEQSVAYRINVGVIPEPTTAIILGLGLTGALSFRRRANRNGNL